MPRITPFLWFDKEAEEAANFYVSIFKDSRIKTISRYGEAGPGPKGQVMVVTFELDGQEFMALNGGPEFKQTEAFSLTVNCKNQKEVDSYWEKLTAGGQEIECGWLKDKFGVFWQVTPTIMGELLVDEDEAKRDRVFRAMLQMKKFDIEEIEAAAEGVAQPA